jgi:hypothetical protein
MPLITRKRILPLLILLLLLTGAWLYSQRFTRVALENYVPETALGYVEINDLPRLLDNFTCTEAWRQLAPVYEVNNGLQYASWANRLGRWTGIGTKESLLLARGQFAVVVTGIEVRGEEVKPRLALLLETHGSAAQVKALLAERVPQLAARAYKQVVQETSEYAGVPITIYRAPQSERKLLAASIGSTGFIANDPEALQACLDVRQGRVAAIAKNAALAQARTTVDRNGDVFAFVSQSGVSRLSQFFTHLLIGKALESTPLAGMSEGLMAEVSERTIDAMAYSTSFVQGGVRDRYAVLCKPEVTDSLRAALRVPANAAFANSEALKLVPATAQEVTLVQIEDPGQALEGVERIVSAHLGVAQSFLFHKFFTSARKTFLGLEAGENASTAVGAEVVRYSLPTVEAEPDERVWIVAARNRQQLTQLAERLLRQQGSNLGRLNHRGVAMTHRGTRAFAFLGNHLVLGSPQQVMRLIEQQQPAWLTTRQLAAAKLPAQAENSVMYSFSSVAEETAQMMAAVARRLKANPQADAAVWLERLPLAATVTSLHERGLYRESHSPVGHFPLLVTFADSLF